MTAEQAAALSECLLADTINKAEALKNQLIIAYSPACERGFFERFAACGAVLLVEQNAGTLGERMSAAFEFAFERNFDSVVMIGTDSPTFPQEFISRAFAFLETDADAVLGKCADGGFYLIGLRHLRKEIFEAVEWSTSRAFEQTARNIKNAGLRLAELPLWYDVDEPADLEKLKNELAERSSSSPRTSEFLKTIYDG